MIATARTGVPLKIEDANKSSAWFTAPKVTKPATMHVILAVTDQGTLRERATNVSSSRSIHMYQRRKILKLAPRRSVEPDAYWLHVSRTAMCGYRKFDLCAYYLDDAHARLLSPPQIERRG